MFQKVPFSQCMLKIYFGKYLECEERQTLMDIQKLLQLPFYYSAFRIKFIQTWNRAECYRLVRHFPSNCCYRAENMGFFDNFI